MPSLLALCSAGALAAPAAGQITVNAAVGFALTWQDTGNNNGILEPGESARFSLTVIMTPGPGVPVTYTGGSATSGTLRGIASGFFDLSGTNSAEGAWTGRTIVQPWDIYGAHGTAADAGARLLDIRFGQAPPNNASINTTNPIISVFEGTWTPASYAVRTTQWAVLPGTSSGGVAARVFILPNGVGEIAENVICGASLGQAMIPIIPAPPGALVLWTAAGFAARRGRSR
jgi:hypothetical protein